MLFNVSPWLERRRAPLLRALTFEPGATSFETDLGRCARVGEPLAQGRHTVRAAVGWLESNALTLTIGPRQALGPPPTAPKAQALAAKLEAECKEAAKVGNYDLARQYAQRIAELDPAGGNKLIEDLEALRRTP